MVLFILNTNFRRRSEIDGICPERRRPHRAPAALGNGGF
jgi:hypothetical protein